MGRYTFGEVQKAANAKGFSLSWAKPGFTHVKLKSKDSPEDTPRKWERLELDEAYEIIKETQPTYQLALNIGTP